MVGRDVAAHHSGPGPRVNQRKGCRWAPVRSRGDLRPRRALPRSRRARTRRARPLGCRRRLRRESPPSARSSGVGVLRRAPHRQRPARDPPRVGATLQGPLPALPDHAGPPRRPQGRVGLPWTPGRGAGRAGARHPQQARDRGVRDRRVQPTLPGVGAPLRGRLRVAHEAHRHVARHRPRLLDARQFVHRNGLVAVPPDVGQRRHLRGPQGGPLLRPLWHGAVEPRARSARRVPGRHRAVGLRALPGRRPRLRPVGVDHHAVDAGVQRRRRGGTRGRVRARGRHRRAPRPGDGCGARRRRAGRRRRGARPDRGRRPGRPPLRAALRPPRAR